MKNFIDAIKNCQICEKHLPHGIRPVFSIHPDAKILLIGQAPGSRVHQTGIPFDDPSGDRLRDWMRLDKNKFYDPSILAIMPMGFCYPGKGKTGDLPPRKECAPEWHPQILSKLSSVELTLLVGKYSQDYYLGKNAQKSLTETVKNWKNYLPEYLPLPHPSPRNNIWLKKNPWFEKELLPTFQKEIHQILEK